MQLTDRIRERYDVRSDLIGGTRFVVYTPQGYRVARLSGSGLKEGRTHRSYSVKVGASTYDNLEAAIRAIEPAATTITPALAPLPEDKTTSINSFLERNNALLASQLFKDYFVVARITPQRGWKYHIARLTLGGVQCNFNCVFDTKDDALKDIGELSNYEDLSAVKRKRIADIRVGPEEKADIIAYGWPSFNTPQAV